MKLKFKKPMLAVPAPADPDAIRLPLWASYKLDGIRCVISEGEARSRKLKPIPNRHVSATLNKLDLPPLDGELMLDGEQDFSKVSSAIMSETGWPRFTYCVFDLLTEDPKTPFKQRYAKLRTFVHEHTKQHPDTPIRLVTHWEISSVEDLEDDMEHALELGHEGLMLRLPDGPYKFGRSTEKEHFLLKVKKMIDDEATIIGVHELMRNENEQTRDELGHAKRSTAKEGQVPAGTLGSLRVEWRGHFFNIGSGFTAKLRQELWNKRDSLTGLKAKFKYQNVGSRGAPRFPIFLGIRHEDDQ